MNDYRCLGLNVIGVDASEEFFQNSKTSYPNANAR